MAIHIMAIYIMECQVIILKFVIYENIILFVVIDIFLNFSLKWILFLAILNVAISAQSMLDPGRTVALMEALDSLS